MRTMVREMRNTYVNLGSLMTPRTATYQPRGTTSNQCFGCGQGGHFARDCSQKNQGIKAIECYKCHRTGHVRRNCPTKQPRGWMGEISMITCGRCYFRGHHESACFTNLREEGQNGGENEHSTQECRGRQHQPHTEATKNELAPVAEGANDWA